jgi:hypothetical protein
MVIPTNHCVGVICTQSHKIASFEAVEIYSLKAPGGRLL